MKQIKRIAAVMLSLVMVLLLIPCFATNVNAQTTYYWPVMGHTNLSQGYHSGHLAIDIADASIDGAPVYAAIGGTVYARYDCASTHYGSYGDCDGMGTGLVIKGDDGRFYVYAHMQAGSI